MICNGIIISMKLPNRKNANIKRKKLTDYLLSLTHKDGKSKAKFFREIGFNETNIVSFKRELLKIAKSNEVIKIDKTKSKIVVKYIIDGVINSPYGKQYKVRTVWAIEVNSAIPHLATARPKRYYTR